MKFAIFVTFYSAVSGRTVNYDQQKDLSGNKRNISFNAETTRDNRYETNLRP